MHKEIGGEERFFLEGAPDDAGAVAAVQNRLVFGRIENFIDAFAEAIEHAKPGSSGAVDGMGDRKAFVIPPGFFGFEKRAMGKFWKVALQKAQRSAECVEGCHLLGF